MSNSPLVFVHRVRAKFREFFHPAKKQIVVRKLRNCDCASARPGPPKEMPWCPRVPQLTPGELHLLHILRQELSCELASEEIDDCDVLHLALRELQLKIRNTAREDLFLRLRFHLRDLNGNDA